MKVKQQLSILFYRMVQKENAEGVPIYIRITIDGQDAEISLGKRIVFTDWDNKRKCSKRKDEQARDINDAIAKARADLKRHFAVLEAQHSQVTPQLLKAAYLGDKAKKVSSTQWTSTTYALSNVVDKLVKRYFDLQKRAHWIKSIKNEAVRQVRQEEIERRQEELFEQVNQALQNANEIFDDKQRPKTLLNTIDYQLIHFLQQVLSDARAGSTLKKWKGTKQKLKSFWFDRYKKIDIPLEQLESSLAGHLYLYLTQQGCKNNAAMKYVKNTKQILDYAVNAGWMTHNPIEAFKCTYHAPRKKLPGIDQLLSLINHDFSATPNLDRARDGFVMMCFTGYAYETLDRLQESDRRVGIDGKPWLYLERTKTDEPESVPILPIVARLIEKYTHHPCRIVSQKLIPVYSNQYFNRLLKKICRQLDIDIQLSTHYGRHIFATMIALDSGADLKAVAQMLGQSSVRSAEIYTKASQINISRTMAMIEKQLFTRDGELKWQSIIHTVQTKTNEEISTDVSATELERMLDIIKAIIATPEGQAKWQNIKNGTQGA